MRVFVDADHAGDQVTRCSRTVFIVFLKNAPIYWSSKKQIPVRQAHLVVILMPWSKQQSTSEACVTSLAWWESRSMNQRLCLGTTSLSYATQQLQNWRWRRSPSIPLCVGRCYTGWVADCICEYRWERGWSADKATEWSKQAKFVRMILHHIFPEKGKRDLGRD